MGFTTKEIGRMTLTLFNKYYDQYRDLFDLEMYLDKTNTTYMKFNEKASETDKWF